MNSYLSLLPRIANYKLSRIGLAKVAPPINLTFSVTNMCQSRCKTCSIWKVYQDDPGRFKEELSLDEIEKSFAGIGEVYFFNISGGEPFLRRDLPQIVAAACKHLKPAVIHTPTNALLPKLIEERTAEILDVIQASGRTIPFTIKPSFDGVGAVHDEIRGVKGNFDKVLETLSRLKKLQENRPNLEVGLGTIISKFNLAHIRETARFARDLGVDSYISEIAEQRTELFNVGHPITLTPEEYERAIGEFNSELANQTVGNARRGVPGSSSKQVAGMTHALRQVYYRYAARILKEQRQVLPCYGGSANAHISPYGDVWPCCILGYDKSMGNLRDSGYDFRAIWHSPKASEVRKLVADGKCWCPLANQAYSNILCSPKAALEVLRERRATNST